MKTEYTCQGASSEGANGENERALTQCSVFERFLGRRPTPEDVDFVLQVAPYFAQVWNEGHRGAGIIAAIIATRMNSSKRILPHHSLLIRTTFNSPHDSFDWSLRGRTT